MCECGPNFMLLIPWRGSELFAPIMCSVCYIFLLLYMRRHGMENVFLSGACFQGNALFTGPPEHVMMLT